MPTTSNFGWTTVNSAVNTDLGSANPVQFMFELTDNGSSQFISGGNNHLFTGTTTMTTASVRNQANRNRSKSLDMGLPL